MLPLPGKPCSTNISLSSWLRALTRILFVNVAFSLFINLIVLISPIYIMQIYNRILPSNSEPTLIMLTGLVCFALIALGVLETVRAEVMVRLGNRLELEMSGRVVEAVFLNALHSGGRSIHQTLGDFDRLRNFLWGPLPSALSDIAWVPFFIMLVFLFHWMLGLVSLCGSIVLLVLTLMHDFATRSNLEEGNRKACEATSFIEQSLRNAQTLEAMGMVADAERRWLRRRRDSLRLQANAADQTALFAGVTKSTRLLLQTALFACGAFLVIRSEITPGAIVAASMLMSRALAPLEITIAGWRQCVAARGAYARLEALLKQEPPRPRRISLPAPRGALRIEDVVAWPEGRTVPTLRSVNFGLAPGDALAVVGASGSGKSTLARLIVGAARPYAGKIRLDNADIHMWNRDQLGPYLGYLPQEVELFEGTVAENIARFGELDSLKIVDAAKRAGTHDTVLKLCQSYETEIGPSGASLSGGQRQLIGLARALYGSPALVVLDEPNSNLDSAGDEALAGAIRQMKQSGTTVILISHRTKVLRHTDHMLMLKDGAATFLKDWQHLRICFSAEADRKVAGAS